MNEDRRALTSVLEAGALDRDHLSVHSISPYDRTLARVRADRARIVSEFRSSVNMSKAEIAAWLDTDVSHSVGWRRGPHEESVGHQSGRRILQILKTPESRLTDEDLLHMRTVLGFIRRHLAQRPRNDNAESKWACSLKNWGRDPSRTRRMARTMK